MSKKRQNTKKQRNLIKTTTQIKNVKTNENPPKINKEILKTTKKTKKHKNKINKTTKKNKELKPRTTSIYITENTNNTQINKQNK